MCDIVFGWELHLLRRSEYPVNTGGSGRLLVWKLHHIYHKVCQAIDTLEKHALLTTYSPP